MAEAPKEKAAPAKPEAKKEEPKPYKPPEYKRLGASGAPSYAVGGKKGKLTQ